MRGHNQAWISGNVGGNLVKGSTKDGRAACSFVIASEGEKKRLTWIRINVYDKLAEYCMTVINKGVYCLVVGELMNREGKYGELTEVRAVNIIFTNPQNVSEFSNDNAPDDEYIEASEVE